MAEYQYYFKENKKVKKAVALSYEAGDMAPKIVATGKGQLAEKIVKTAEEAKGRFIKMINWQIPCQN